MNDTIKIIGGQKTKNNQHNIEVEQSWKTDTIQVSDTIKLQ